MEEIYKDLQLDNLEMAVGKIYFSFSHKARAKLREYLPNVLTFPLKHDII